MFKCLSRPWIIVLTLIVFALLLVPATALAQASPPHLFIGEAGAVTEGPNNEPVKSGTITVWIDDEEIISGTITDGAYSLLVEQPSGSNFSGKFVQFMVDGSPTDNRALWKVGGADIVPLKVIPKAVPATQAATKSPPAQVATESPSAQAEFREGPTVRLRPVEDVITSDQDGILEAFMFNPSVNDWPMTVDFMLTVPSNIHIYGQGFVCSGTGAGSCAGSFTISPGITKTVGINVKSDKIGEHTVHLSGYRWPGDNKDRRQPISLTHRFKVISPSNDLTAPEQGKTRVTVETKNTKIEIEESQPTGDEGSKSNDGSCGMSPGGSIPLGSIGLFLGVGLMGFRGMFGNLF
jgi:hypothetical protein